MYKYPYKIVNISTLLKKTLHDFSSPPFWELAKFFSFVGFF